MQEAREKEEERERAPLYYSMASALLFEHCREKRKGEKGKLEREIKRDGDCDFLVFLFSQVKSSPTKAMAACGTVGAAHGDPSHSRRRTVAPPVRTSLS